MATRPAIVKLGKVKEPKNILVFGESGCGKTILAASHGGLLIAGERGVASAQSRYPDTDAMIVHDWAEWLAAVQYLRQGNWKKWQWVSVDSITEIQDLGKQFIIDREFKRSPNGGHSEYNLEWTEHQEWHNSLKKHIKDLCALPVNCFFTALPMESEIGDEGRVMPFIDGKKGAISQYVCGLMGAVGYMEELRVKSAGQVVTRRRTNWTLSTAREDSDRKRFGKNRYYLPRTTDDLAVPQLEALITKQIAAQGAPATPVRPVRRRRVASK